MTRFMVRVIARRLWYLVTVVLIIVLVWRTAIFFGVTTQNPSHVLSQALIDVDMPITRPTRKASSVKDSALHGHNVGQVHPSMFHQLRYHKSVDRSRTIFVMLVSPGPKHCVQVVSTIFSTAEHPRDIFVGVVEETDDVEVSHCVNPSYALLNQSKFSPGDNIRTRRLLSSRSTETGSKVSYSWYLYIASMMFRNEHYVLAIASHTLLLSRWDFLLISTYQQAIATVTPKLVLTTIPSRYATPTSEANVSSGSAGLPLCELQFGSSKLPSVVTPRSKEGGAAASKGSSSSPLVSHSLIFGPGRMTADVPLDPHLRHLGDHGFDFLWSARLWTAGYDFRTIGFEVAVTLQNASEVTKMMESSSLASTQRAIEVLSDPRAHEPYGLGQERPIGDFLKRTHVDLIHRRQRSPDCP